MYQEVVVELDERSYPIRIGSGTLSQLGEFCQRAGLSSNCLLVTDSNVDPRYGEVCLAALQSCVASAHRVVVPAGEKTKSADHLFSLYDESIAVGLDRRSFVVALGGGVVGDLAGYLAASFLRGIAYIQVPTTLVAMVDSAVGGKTGINLSQGKNLVGSFHQPIGVYTDLATLDTLPDREFVSGLAEVLKYGVIWDARFFGDLEANVEKILARDPVVLERIVSRSCEIKSQVVHQDERESGLRAILNFGHTVGHAIERIAGYESYLHGEAIAIGMNFATKLSQRKFGLLAQEADRIEKLLVAFGLPRTAPTLSWQDLRRAISVDKKSVDRLPRFVLATSIGEVVFGCDVNEGDLEDVWHALCE